SRVVRRVKTGKPVELTAWIEHALDDDLCSLERNAEVFGQHRIVRSGASGDSEVNLLPGVDQISRISLETVRPLEPRWRVRSVRAWIEAIVRTIRPADAVTVPLEHVDEFADGRGHFSENDWHCSPLACVGVRDSCAWRRYDTDEKFGQSSSERGSRCA